MNEITGATIKKVRKMTKAEMTVEGWDPLLAPPTVLVLSNGVKIYPSQDDEGNGPGAIFGIDNGNPIAIRG
mgnify:CR=1 FL=1